MPSDVARSHRQLVVWQKAMDLTLEVYRLTGNFPREETYGLTSQLRRAAVSVPSNIAEGYARHTTRELVQFVALARGSLAEVDTQLAIAPSLGYIPSSRGAAAEQLMLECQRMLSSMQGALRERIRNGTARR